MPAGMKYDGTYVIHPRGGKDRAFYVIASSRPHIDGGGCSISMVCYDEALSNYPWLDPRLHHDEGGESTDASSWEREYRASSSTSYSAEGDGTHASPVGSSNDDDGDHDETTTTATTTRSATLSERLRAVFAEEMPAFHMLLDDDVYRTARVNRRTTWLRMSANTIDDGASYDGASARYSTSDGRVALIGDAAHAMTPSMGEGCNVALESAVRLVDDVSAAMREGGKMTCDVDAMSEGFVRYGSSRPCECIPVQMESRARNIYGG